MPVINDLRQPTSQSIALDLLLRAMAVALASIGILGLLPVIVEAVG